MAVNFRGVYLGMHYGIPVLLGNGGGVIVNTASMSAEVAFPGMSVYCASKGAVKMLTNTAAMEYADKGIRANCISPGTIHTSMVDALPEEFMKAIVDANPVKRIGQPREVPTRRYSWPATSRRSLRAPRSPSTGATPRCRRPRGYRPTYVPARFSEKAAKASAESRVEVTTAWWEELRSKAVRRSWRAPWRTARLIIWMATGDRRTRCQVPGVGGHCVRKVYIVVHLVDEADGQRVRRVDHLASPEHVQRPGGPHDSWQQPTSAVARHESNLDVGLGNRAERAVKRRSQSKAMSRPAPIAGPWMAARTGLSRSSSACATPVHPPPSAGLSRQGDRASRH